MADENVGAPLSRLKKLGRGRVSDDGETVSFRIEVTSGDVADLVCGTDEIGDIIGFLCQLAEAAGKHRGRDGTRAKMPRNSFIPVPATGLGFAVTNDDFARAFPGPIGEELANRPAVVLLRLSGFDLSFRLANMKLSTIPSYLRQSADRIERSIR